jgi:hypothetical protein
MAFLHPEKKRDILNETASCGSVKVAISNLNISYTDYKELIEREPDFENRVKEASQFFVDNLNSVIPTLAKKKLFDILSNGVTHTITSTEEIKDAEGNLVGTKSKITRKYSPAPIAAINQGIALMPPIENAISLLVQNNSLPKESLEKLQTIVKTYQGSLRDLLTVMGEDKTLNPEILATFQRALTGSKL